MDISIYLEKDVKIYMVNGFFYEGTVLDCDSDSLTLRNLKDQIVTISVKSISSIREVEK